MELIEKIKKLILEIQSKVDDLEAAIMELPDKIEKEK